MHDVGLRIDRPSLGRDRQRLRPDDRRLAHQAQLQSRLRDQRNQTEFFGEITGFETFGSFKVDSPNSGKYGIG
jgi:hypothetical protein